MPINTFYSIQLVPQVDFYQMLLLFNKLVLNILYYVLLKTTNVYQVSIM